MESFDLGYSPKNVPVPAKDNYLKTLIDKTEHFLKRLRWKVFWAQNRGDIEEELNVKESFGFKTSKTPPRHQDLEKFEEDVYDLINSIEFKEEKTDFQRNLENDIETLKKSQKIIVPADKTNNLYLLDKDDYKKMLTENVTKTYKKCDEKAVDDINKTSAILASNLDLEDKVEMFTTDNCFITLKDHKTDFRRSPKCRLINPAKNQIGKVSKTILEKIIGDIKQKSCLNLWKSTKDVIEWFKILQCENKTKFIKFDIVEFYPSITSSLLTRAVNFAKLHTDISDDDVNIMMHAKNSLLFSEGSAWEKKDGRFDVTMGSYDGAETCELVGLYLLHKMNKFVPANQIGLYRDDGLAIIPDATGHKIDQIRKRITQVFKDEGLKITVEANLKITDFLDITMNLENGRYSPFMKPNSTPLYVNSKSNHPPNIIKNLPSMIERRISDISCDEVEFDKAKAPYSDALEKSGYTHELKFNETPTTASTTRKRKRNVLWFNPPYNMNVKTDVGRKFFKLLRKHFPPSHNLHKLINKNSVKLSYSCMPSMQRIIKSINQRALNEKGVESTQTRTCNCRNQSDCPLQNKCLEKTLVYKASIETEGQTFSYFGTSEGEFKTRYSNHTSSFRHESKRNSTELSKKVWELKESGKEYLLTWEIAKKAFTYKGGGTKCDLCLTEKLLIVTNQSKFLLNKRTEMISKCRHKNKFLLRKCF